MRLPSVTLLASLFLTLLPASAKIEYRVKNQDALLFNNPGLTPPPLGFMEEGAVLGLIYKGTDASKVRRADGTIGWMANKDIIAMNVAKSTKHQLGEQAIVGEELAVSPIILSSQNPDVDVLGIQRTFTGDLVEFTDREQVEIRNGEN